MEGGLNRINKSLPLAVKTTRCPAFDPTGAGIAASRSSVPQVPNNSAHSGCAAIRAVQIRRARGFNSSAPNIAIEDLAGIFARLVTSQKLLAHLLCLVNAYRKLGPIQFTTPPVLGYSAC